MLCEHLENMSTSQRTGSSESEADDDDREAKRSADQKAGFAMYLRERRAHIRTSEELQPAALTPQEVIRDAAER